MTVMLFCARCAFRTYFVGGVCTRCGVAQDGDGLDPSMVPRDAGPRKTWRDVEDRSLQCVVLHRMLAEISGGLPREEAMIRALLSLSASRETLIRERVEAFRMAEGTR